MSANRAERRRQQKEAAKGRNMYSVDYHLGRVRPTTVGDGYIVNMRGAKIYDDIARHPVYDVRSDGKIEKVLSIGRHPSGALLMTLQDNDEPRAYVIKDDHLEGWALQLMVMSMSGTNLLPSRVEFGKVGQRSYAEMI